MATAASVPSLEQSALHPTVSASPLAAQLDWSLDWRVAVRSGAVVLWAWSVGRLGLSALWVVATSLLLVFSIVRQRKHVAFHQTLKFQKLMHDPAALQSSLPLIPPWIAFPDMEKADFIATLVTQLWPVIKEASEAVVLQVVSPLMDKLKPPFLTSLSFQRLDLGNVPPSIPGVRLQSADSGEIMLDIEVEFAGNVSQSAQPHCPPLSRPPPASRQSSARTVRAPLSAHSPTPLPSCCALWGGDSPTSWWRPRRAPRL